jgi:hypothetical protein
MASKISIGPDGGPYIAINENSGDIELEDNSGNVVAKWDETNTQWDFISNDIQNVGSLGVDEADINNETFIRAVRASTNSGISAGNWVNITDNETSDNLGEFNNLQFSPDETGVYRIEATARFENLNDGDRLILRVRNITDSETDEPRFHEETGGADDETVQGSYPYKLESSKTYEIQVQNANSQSTLRATDTQMAIIRSIIG